MTPLTFARPDGGTCNGYYAAPPNAAGAPGLVVLQEWWGVNDQIKQVAEQYAALGYRVLLPDLYRGKLGLDAKEAEHLMTGLNFADAASQDIRGAVLHLKAGGGKVGVVGYCMGGALTVLSAVFVPEVDAAVTWYGFPPIDYVDASKVKAPVQGHFATEDAFFPIVTADALEQKLKAAGVQCSFYKYVAQHAFANDRHVGEGMPMKYDPTAAATAWTRTTAFFATHLGPAARS